MSARHFKHILNKLIIQEIATVKINSNNPIFNKINHFKLPSFIVSIRVDVKIDLTEQQCMHKKCHVIELLLFIYTQRRRLKPWMAH